MTTPYRARAPVAAEPKPATTVDRYRAAWKDYRIRRRNRIIAFFAWAPLALLTTQGLQAIVGSPLTSDQFFIAACPFWIGALGFLVYPSFFKCPRCGERFEYASGFRFRNPFAYRCLHCKLEVDELSSDR